MPIQLIVEFTLTFIGFFIAYAISRLANKNQPNIFKIIVVMFLLTLVLTSLNYFFKKNIIEKSTYAFEYNVEGLWIQDYKLNGSQRYSIINITFKDNQLLIKGGVYDSIGVRTAHWNSLAVNPMKDSENILYLYEGEFDNGKKLADKGISELRFIRNQEGSELITARGYFMDHFSGWNPQSFDIDKVSDEYWQSLMGKTSEFKSSEYSLFIKEHHRTKTK